MKSMFTIHAGEVLVGSYLERTYKDLRIWLPSRDTGDDLLVTNKEHTRAVSLQVKFSKDFLGEKNAPTPQIKSGGWFTFDYDKLENSTADLWVLVLYGFNREYDFVVIEPSKLIERYRKLGRTFGLIQSYIWVTKTGHCWETRGLGRADQEAIAAGNFESRERDLSSFLNSWLPLEYKTGYRPMKKYWFYERTDDSTKVIAVLVGVTFAGPKAEWIEQFLREQGWPNLKRDPRGILHGQRLWAAEMSEMDDQDPEEGS